MKNTHTKIKFIEYLFFLTLIVSCQSINDDELPVSSQSKEISLQVINYEQMPFFSTRASSDPKGVITQLSYVLFSNGVKFKELTQDTTATNFGNISLAVPFGSYDLVVIGHNSPSAATINSQENVSFPNNKIYETFYVTKPIVVNETSSSSIELLLKRAIARFRLQVTDNKPKNVKRATFIMSGGGYTFNPKTGTCASKQSQEINIEIPSSYDDKPSLFGINTFLPSEKANINVSVSFKDSANNVLVTRNFENIPMQTNFVTHYAGPIFSSNKGYNIKVDSDWSGTNEYTFNLE